MWAGDVTGGTRAGFLLWKVKPSKHKTCVWHLCNVGPTSVTLDRRCMNVIQMFCVYWESEYRYLLTYISRHDIFSLHGIIRREDSTDLGHVIGWYGHSTPFNPLHPHEASNHYSAFQTTDLISHTRKDLRRKMFHETVLTICLLQDDFLSLPPPLLSHLCPLEVEILQFAACSGWWFQWQSQN